MKLRDIKETQTGVFQYDLSAKPINYSAPIKILLPEGSIIQDNKKSHASEPAFSDTYTSDSDPLSDDKYEVYHAKMERDERRTQAIEAEKNASEIEKLQTQKSLLQSANWMKELPKITAVRDKNNLEEMEMYRALTLNDIGIYLRKFANWKTAQRELQATIRQHQKEQELKDEKRRRALEKMEKQLKSAKAKEARAQKSATSTKTKRLAKANSFFKEKRHRISFDDCLTKAGQSRRCWAFGSPFPSMAQSDFMLPIGWIPVGKLGEVEQASKVNQGTPADVDKPPSVVAVSSKNAGTSESLTESSAVKAAVPEPKNGKTVASPLSNHFVTIKVAPTVIDLAI